MSPSWRLPDTSRYAGGGSLNPCTQDEFKGMGIGCQPGKHSDLMTVMFFGQSEKMDDVFRDGSFCAALTSLLFQLNFHFLNQV